MTLRLLVMCLAALVVLGYIWYRNRAALQRHEPRERAGRAVSDEAAQAFEDVADQIIAGSERLHHPVARSGSRRREAEAASREDATEAHHVQSRP
ncbi:MAG: hypothetical protein EON57_03020 [Alphaproteobacteria bacterium]|nr:MAG: hypothetical protein EON57_03020 [Alphaproteobacteria bacterium]